MTQLQLRQKAVSTATAWLGCKESDGSHRKIIDVYNSHKPLARGYKVQYTDPWCATFVSAVAIQAGLTTIMPTECSCSRMIALYKNLGRWQENDAYRPQPGDLVMYDWDDSGKADCTGAPEHVGMVCDLSGGSMRVIEGNKSHAVGYRSIKVNGRYIRGYCLPDYASLAIPDDLSPEQAIDLLAQAEIIDSPDYWKQVLREKAGQVPYFDCLLIKMALRVRKEAGVHV